MPETPATPFPATGAAASGDGPAAKTVPMTEVAPSVVDPATVKAVQEGRELAPTGVLDGASWPVLLRKAGAKIARRNARIARAASPAGRR